MTSPYNAPKSKTEHQSPLTWREGDMPYSEEYSDFYYSRTDGRAETRHVFLGGNQLPERFADKPQFTIGELGFGTGLNFLETWHCWSSSAPEGAVLDFHSFELNLLSGETMQRALSAWPELAAYSDTLIAQWPSKEPSKVAGDVLLSFVDGSRSLRLHIHHGFAQQTLRIAQIKADAWYLDGFAPSRNPDMWSQELLAMVAERTVPGGSFATYSAAGWVRRNLTAAGFIVEKRPGHAGKRDMSVGRLPES